MIGVGGVKAWTENTITKSSYRREQLLNELHTHEIKKNLFGHINLLDLRRKWGCRLIISYFRRDHLLNESDWSRAPA
jgi:hypothetical protein